MWKVDLGDNRIIISSQDERKCSYWVDECMKRNTFLQKK
jgi:hypothetical protein